MSANSYKPFVGLLASALLLACSRNHSGAPATEATQYAPAIPGTARLYVLNTGQPAFTISQNTVYDGQQKLVSVSEQRYAIVLIYGGRHTLSCAGMPAAAPVYFEAVPGQTYYLQTYVGWGSTNRICALLPPMMGQKALAELHVRSTSSGTENRGKN
jgi:hypothetical protein